MNRHKRYGLYFIIIFAMILILTGCSFRNAPPSIEEAGAFLEQNRKDIDTVVDYLKGLEFNSVFIDKRDGTIFYNFEHHAIFSEIETGVRNLWDAGCTHISKDAAQEINTISIEIWYRTIGDEDCGIACTIDGQGTPKTAFQIYCELIDDGWYYFHDDYEEYRSHLSQYAQP